MRDFICSLIKELLAVEVIWENQNGPKPKKPFATILLSPVGTRGMDEKRKTDGKVEVIGQREAVLEVNYFGSNAVDTLVELDQKMRSDTVADRCFNEGVVFFDSGDVLDITELLDSNKFEERAMIEFRIRFAKSYIDQPGYFETVEIPDWSDTNP